MKSVRGGADMLIAYNSSVHHFEAPVDIDVHAMANRMSLPLSVILQVTRRCNLDCSFCSETEQIPDPSVADLEVVAAHLAGVRRVFLSGGEPLLRRDLSSVLDLFAGKFLLGLATNATPAKKLARKLADKVAAVNVGLEGPRTITNRVRGNYDKIVAGMRVFLEVGVPISVSAVVLKSVADGLGMLGQIADDFGAGKVKLIMPIRKGNGARLTDDEFLSNDEATEVFCVLRDRKARWGWRPELRMTLWTPETEGYSILMYPDCTTWAWPVFDAPNKVEYLGSLLREPMTEIWRRYRFKANHVRKYLGRSILTA